MLNNSSRLKFKISIILLLAFYVSGIIGILTNNKTIDFLSLTPLNLIVNGLLFFINHEKGTKKQWVVFIFVAFFGFFIEVVGVNTGLIFGNYSYQTTLGWKLFETPLIIGVNWMLLTGAAVFSVESKIKSKIVIALFSAFLLLALDILIEPVAMQYDFWTWDQNIVPLKNYVAWFGISFFLCYLLTYFKGESKNNLAPYLLILQFVFFGIFNLVIWK